jgi:RES domain-containing protein
VKLNRAFTEFSRRLREASEISRPWKGTIYRVTSLQYHDPNEILTGEGSYRYGGRWNAIRSFRAVYGSVDDVTALKESKANAEYANLRYPFRETRLVVAVEVSLSRVADLTSPQTLKALEITEEELRTEDWRNVQEQGFESLTQALGRAVFESKAEGLLAFSARVPQAINIAYFPQNKLRGSEVKLCEAQKLRDLKPE